MVAIEWFEGPREELDDLFALADESSAAVRGYRDLGRLLVARDGPEVIGHLQLIPGERAGEAEVKSLAVRPVRQGEGVGQMLVNHAVAVCRDESISTVCLSTSPADARVLHFYQRLGFRLVRVVRDVFTPEAGSDGATVYSRMFAPNFGVFEDPATGSASGPLGCYLVRHQMVPPEHAGAILSLQGAKMGRPSHVHIAIGTSGGDITSVRVGGEAVLAGEGTLYV